MTQPTVTPKACLRVLYEFSNGTGSRLTWARLGPRMGFTEQTSWQNCWGTRGDSWLKLGYNLGFCAADGYRRVFGEVAASAIDRGEREACVSSLADALHKEGGLTPATNRALDRCDPLLAPDMLLTAIDDLCVALMRTQDDPWLQDHDLFLDPGKPACPSQADLGSPASPRVTLEAAAPTLVPGMVCDLLVEACAYGDSAPGQELLCELLPADVTEALTARHDIRDVLLGSVDGGTRRDLAALMSSDSGLRVRMITSSCQDLLSSLDQASLSHGLAWLVDAYVADARVWDAYRDFGATGPARTIAFLLLLSILGPHGCTVVTRASALQ